MNQYIGSVFFVDILGVSALTRRGVAIGSTDYKAHGIKSDKYFSEQCFCAKLLMKFRKILNNYVRGVKGVKFAQLSDCAFIWSRDSLILVDTAIAFMWKALQSGILCRGGIAYGKIVEPDHVNTSLGQFILGEAATKAADLEHAGKGCRIFSDIDLPSEMSGKMSFQPDPFVGVRNPNDCKVTDELRWYLFPKGINNRVSSHADRIEVADEILKLISLLMFSPLFRWNASTPAGEVQMACSVERISSGIELFTNSCEHRKLSESLVGYMEKNRNNQAREQILKEWRAEIRNSITKSVRI